MIRGRWGILLAFTIALQGGVNLASSQERNVSGDETLTVKVLENGLPVSGAELSAMINGIKGPVAGRESESVTDDAGDVSFPTNLLNIIKGTRVEVYRVRCETGRVEVILAPEGEGDACVAEGARTGERCECERIGAFVWGGGTATIDIGTGTVTGPEPTGGVGAQPPPRLKFTIGVTGSEYPKLEDTACATATCDVDDTSAGFFGSLETVLWGPFVFGVEGGKSGFGVREPFQYAPGIDGTNKTDVNLWWFNPYMGLTWNLGQWSAAYFAFGAVYLRNVATVVTHLPLLGLTEREERKEGGWRASLDLGYELKIATWGGIRTGYRYVRGDSGDADEHHRLSLGFFINVLRGR